MRLNLWLAQPETEQRLGAILRIAVAAFALWAVAAGYGLWSGRAAVAAARAVVLSQSKQLSQVAEEIPGKRREAANAAKVRIDSPESAASAEITAELAGIAQATGAEVAGVRIGDTGPPKATAASSSAPTSGTTTAASGAATAAPAAASAGDGWDQETFECNIAGEYGALTRFLNELAASRHVLDLTSLQVTQADSQARPDAPRLTMKLSGIVYERPETP